MSVEKMEMMNVIGYLGDLDDVSMEIIRQGCVHVVNAFNEINQNNFTIMIPDENTNVLTDLCFIKPYNKSCDYSAATEKIERLMDLFGVEKGIRKKYLLKKIAYENVPEKIDSIYDIAIKHLRELENSRKDLLRIREFQRYMETIRNVRLDFALLRDLRFFSFKIGKLSKENYEKLKDNIENISSIIYEVCSTPGTQVILSLSPKVLDMEVDRILASLNFEEIKVPYGIYGSPSDILSGLEEKANERQDEIKMLDGEITKLADMYRDFIDECYSMIKMLEKVQVINSEVACTNEFFYMAGWVPASKAKGLQKKLGEFGSRLILVFKPQSEVSSSITPPTRLKNNWFIRPFEALVRMYGIPSYNETDPTAFVAISYMIMFGSMFGDVGQGFIFLAAGLLLAHKFRRPNLGGVLSRIGASSMIFGALFGSVFGDENILKPLLFYPMENINTILLGGVVLGVVFTTIGFLYSLVNAVKRRDVEEGIFGKDGLAGFLFYWIILLTAISIYMGSQTIIPMPVIVAVLCVLLGFMVIKKPVSNLIRGHRPLYDEPLKDYYIESGFGVFETLLSMLSNTISFIRIGAFTLNHVGLFIAFATIANMMKGGAGGTFMLILGNVVVIGLEGMVVFIQGLRLEYYELFSKYYKGSGIEYSPIRLMCSSKTDRAVEVAAKSDVQGYIVNQIKHY